MTLKTRLTLGSVLLATLIAGAISAVDLANVMHLEFDATLDRAQLMKNVAAELVYGKAGLLAFGGTPYYQIEQVLGTPEGQPLLYVRVIVAPALIYEDIQKSLAGNAAVALLARLGAVSIAFLASAVAFRKLGQIGRMLDQAASGDFEEGPPGLAGADELSVVASKVNLLGQRLRGAQVEVSDLRGNIDHLLRDLEDAVFVFNRELRLIFASGSVEKFLGKERAWFSGPELADVFPPATALGLPRSEEHT